MEGIRLLAKLQPFVDAWAALHDNETAPIPEDSLEGYVFAAVDLIFPHINEQNLSRLFLPLPPISIHLAQVISFSSFHPTHSRSFMRNSGVICIVRRGSR